METNKYQFSIGFNDRYTLKSVCGIQEGITLIRDLGARYFGFCTVIPGRGAYIMDDTQTQVCENSAVCIYYGDLQEETIKAFCKEVKTVLNQQSVIMEKTIVNSDKY